MPLIHSPADLTFACFLTYGQAWCLGFRHAPNHLFFLRIAPWVSPTAFAPDVSIYAVAKWCLRDSQHIRVYAALLP